MEPPDQQEDLMAQADPEILIAVAVMFGALFFYGF